MDVVVDCRDKYGDVIATIFVENKYNPDGLRNPRWFSDDQWGRQRAALDSLGRLEKQLVGIASAEDLATRKVPPYDVLLDWDTVADLATAAGGSPDWRRGARLPTAAAADRLLLEFVSYLKGDTLGALEAEDLLALERIYLASDRAVTLLERAARQLDPPWHDKAREDWTTSGGSWIVYVTIEAPKESWLRKRNGGLAYLFIASSVWGEERADGESTIYAGGGWESKPGERSAVTRSKWAATVTQQRFELRSDKAGIYIVQRRPLAEIVSSSRLLSDQVTVVADWAAEAIDGVGRLPDPQTLEASAGQSARARLRARRMQSMRKPDA